MPVTFNTYKINTLSKLYNRRLINKTEVQEIMKSKTKYAFTERISDCYFERAEQNSEKATEIAKRGFVLPSDIPPIKSMRTKLEEMSVIFAKILSKEDKKPEVLSIKNEIKNEFGIKDLYLDNNLPYAKKIQKALRILKVNNIPLADEIIVNSVVEMSMGISGPQKKIMILNPNIKPEYYLSTDSPLHLIIHEGIHVSQPNDVTINFSKVPEQYREVANNLSLYASNNFLLEVHAELKTKQLLNPKSFTNKERELLNYIENLFGNLN